VVKFGFEVWAIQRMEDDLLDVLRSNFLGILLDTYLTDHISKIKLDARGMRMWTSQVSKKKEDLKRFG